MNDDREVRTVGMSKGPEEKLGPEKEHLYREEFQRRFRFSERCFAEHRYHSKKFFDTYAGDPWPEGVLEQMESEGRPATSINYAIGTANTVLGQDMADRKEPRFKAVAEGGDFLQEFNAENFTRVVRQVYQNTKAHRQESMAHLDQLVTGYGWAEVFLNTFRFPHRIEIQYVDCFEIYVDPNYQQDNCIDARYVIRERRWSLEQAQAKWPEKREELETLTRSKASPYRSTMPRRTPDATVASGGQRFDPDQDDPHVYIYEYQRKRYEPFVAYKDPLTKAYRKVPKAKFPEIQKGLLAQLDPQTGMPLLREMESVEYTQEIVDRGFLAGAGGTDCEVLEGPRQLETGMFTYRCATGFRRKDRAAGRTMHFGLVALAYEPQLLASKALSSGIEYIARGTKGGIVFDPQGLEDPGAFPEESVKPGARIAASEGWLAEGKKIFEKLPEPVWNNGYDTVFRIAVQGGEQSSNITASLKGTLQTERSNVLISNLQQKALVSLLPILEPLAQFRVELAQLVAIMVQKFFPADKFNQILATQKLEGVTYSVGRDPATGEEIEEPILMPDIDSEGNPILDPSTGEAYQRPVTPWDLSRDIDIFEFNITSDLGAASATAKEALWRMMNDHAAFNDMMKDPDLKDLIVPWMIENIPDFPAEDAKTMARKLRERFRMREMQGTVEGVMAALETFPPEMLAQIQQAAVELQQAAMGAGDPSQQMPPQ